MPRFRVGSLLFRSAKIALAKLSFARAFTIILTFTLTLAKIHGGTRKIRRAKSAPSDGPSSSGTLLRLALEAAISTVSRLQEKSRDIDLLLRELNAVA